MVTKRTVIRIEGTGPDCGLFETTSRLADALEGFAATLSQSEVLRNAKELLPRTLQLAARFDLQRSAIADACQVSEPTISRWASGQVKPHAIVARVAVEAVARLAVQKAEEYRREYQDVL